MNALLGWDIGGVNTKLARVDRGRVTSALSRPFEIQRAPGRLPDLLREMANELRTGGNARNGEEVQRRAHAVTMTAELSQMFRTKRDGVRFVLDALEQALPGEPLHVYTTRGVFLTAADARLDPLAVAAANWMATATLVADMHPDAILVDIGTTTTDVIPIVGGRVVASGRTDPDRLAHGELVYTGAVRTPVEAIVSAVPYGSRHAAVSAEGFALAGDVHVWRGALGPSDYEVPTPDGRPATREYARERLARVVCADVDMLDDDAISAITDAVAAAQIDQVAAAISRVAVRHPGLRRAVVTGVGAFIADAAARRAGVEPVPLAHELGDAGARCAPAAAVALLLERVGSPATPGDRRVPRT